MKAKHEKIKELFINGMCFTDFATTTDVTRQTIYAQKNVILKSA